MGLTASSSAPSILQRTHQSRYWRSTFPPATHHSWGCSPRPRLSKFLSRSESGSHQAVAATATRATSMRLQRWHGTPVCPLCLKWPAGHGHWGLNWRDLPTQWDRRATTAWKVYNNKNNSNNNKSIYIARNIVQRQQMFIDSRLWCTCSIVTAIFKPFFRAVPIGPCQSDARLFMCVCVCECSVLLVLM